VCVNGWISRLKIIGKRLAKNRDYQDAAKFEERARSFLIVKAVIEDTIQEIKNEND